MTATKNSIVSVIDIDGNVVAWYTYDSWGNILDYGGELAHTNPITYRGYYFDWELGLYYLQSRYYCPALCRFVSADVFMDTGVGILGTNMYIYANNNPVMFIDPDGFMARALFDTMTNPLRVLWDNRNDIGKAVWDAAEAEANNRWLEEQARAGWLEDYFATEFEPNAGQVQTLLNVLGWLDNTIVGAAGGTVRLIKRVAIGATTAATTATTAGVKYWEQFKAAALQGGQWVSGQGFNTFRALK
ncbi:MAG: RHS repeat-associated core domain-containing protein [Oscillospiraceae bacterium]|nr:RHS repeat-associated core domain-containing protein [Oscillospiraceae bacterium]